MGFRFLSPEWLEEGRRVVDGSATFRAQLRDVAARLITVVSDVPGGGTVTLYHEFRDGRLVRVERNPEGAPAARTADFTLRGTYDTFERLQRGTLTLQAAYLQRLVRIEGDLAQAMRFAPAFATYQALVRTVETEF